MTKKEYILSLENLIVNRVKYHAPKTKDEVDYALLEAVGIDESYPIFIFDRPLNKIYYKAFCEAKKRVDFNLLLTQRPQISTKKVDKLDKTFVILNDEIGSELENTLHALNINYFSHTNFNFEQKKEYLKVNDKDITFDYIPYFYTKKTMHNGVICDIKNFLLNGKNYVLNFINTSYERKEAKFEFNLPLPRGYYIFKQGNNFVEIKNLVNKEKAYFNFNLKNAKISFSLVSGIENCTFPCINLECKVELLAKETRCCYFNFGENKFCLASPKEVNEFLKISQRKMNEIFDIKVTTKDCNFDQLFNSALPQNIWEKWQKFEVDEESENKWIKMRNDIVKNEGKALQISKTFKGLKEVRFFRNYRWKRVFIVHNHACYLFADKVKYFNFTLLTKEIFDKNNEIYLSFAE